MFKLLTILILSALLAACGTVQTAKDNNPRILGPYKVEGNGKTFEEAKSDAFKKAIEQAVGVAVMSEREVRNKELVKQYVLTHSSGYVERYGVLEKQTNGSQHKLLVEVYVRTGNMVSDYAIYRSKDATNIDGSRAAVNHRTYQDSVDSGNSMLNAVLDDFPEKAYDIEVLPITVFTNAKGKPVVQVNYNIRYSSKYLQGLGQVLDQLKDGDCNWFCDGYFFRVDYYENPNDLLPQNKQYFFKDKTRPEMIMKKLYNTRDNSDHRFAVKVDYLNSSGKVLWTHCDYPWYSTYQYFTYRLSAFKHQNGLWPVTPEGFALQVSEADVEALSRVEVNAVGLYKCRSGYWK